MELECRGAGQVVEGEDLLHPARARESLGLLRDEAGAGGDHQHVVGQLGTVDEVHGVGLEVHPLGRHLAVVDRPVELAAAWSHDVLGVGQAEGHEQQAGLVDVPVVDVDDGDRRRVG